MSETLYERLGGQEAVEKVVEYFYHELVLKDPTVQHFFEHTDIKKQIRHQTKFISFALGGPNQYSGHSMEKAHKGLNLQPEHFEAIATHLGEALRHFGVSENDVNEALSKVVTLKDAILYQ